MFGSKSLTAWTLLSSLITESGTSKILAFYPMPFKSHQMTFYSLTNELVERGHEVTVVTTDPFYTKGETPENLTEINIHDVSYLIWEQFEIETAKDLSIVSNINRIAELNAMLFEQQILVPEVQTILKKNKNYFDLILVEASSIPGVFLSHIFDAPLVQISSFGAFMHNLDAIGAPTHPFLYPTVLRKRIHNLSLWEKMTELHTHLWLTILKQMIEEYSNKMIKKHFGTDAPTLDKLRNNVDMLFLNVNPMWVGNMPVPPGIVYTGGMHLKPQKELPEDIKSYLDSSKNGVIYVSFGTTIKTSTITPINRQKFINVLKNVSYDVLWKWDQEDFPAQTTNIKISKWLPQADLLRHPKLKLFITQGGIHSTDEAIAAGVPLLGIPMIADQFFNSEKYIYFKIGMKIDFESLTEDNLREAINIVINDESYRKNVEQLRRKMYDQPQRPMERAIWWIEYLLRHGGAKHLRTPAANMSWVEYYELKLICVVLVTFLTIMYSLLKIVKYIWKLLSKMTHRLKLKMA